eukprot:TRINITY_DN1630_c0_g1_i2.p1 TRINITY_DN1630_c0_g1~~TRINITY_DN1630_c0_g1_i2.p1  ORF type:complete len:419 (+),score=83.13 TRINITY_DN1630_c0_g1_i2:117-1259(+)
MADSPTPSTPSLPRPPGGSRPASGVLVRPGSSTAASPAAGSGRSAVASVAAHEPSYPKPRPHSAGLSPGISGFRRASPCFGGSEAATSPGASPPCAGSPAGVVFSDSGAVGAAAQSDLPVLAHRVRVPGRLAGALLTSMGSYVPGGEVEQKMLQAAIMAVAPRPYLVPCSSQSCCWRWATESLLEDYARVRAEANHARVVLVEELGDSINQRFINLQEEFRVTHARAEAATKELDGLRRAKEVLELRNSKLNANLTEAVRERDEMQVARLVAERDRAALETRTTDTIAELRKELEDFRHDRLHIRELKRRAEEAEAAALEAKQQRDEVIADLNDAKKYQSSPTVRRGSVKKRGSTARGSFKMEAKPSMKKMSSVKVPKGT